MPATAPGWFANLTPIPRVNTPRRGPPTNPKTAKDACKTVEPRALATKVVAMQTSPYAMAVTFKTVAPFRSKNDSCESHRPEKREKKCFVLETFQGRRSLVTWKILI